MPKNINPVDHMTVQDRLVTLKWLANTLGLNVKLYRFYELRKKKFHRLRKISHKRFLKLKLFASITMHHFLLNYLNKSSLTNEVFNGALLSIKHIYEGALIYP